MRDVWIAPRGQIPALDMLRSAAIFMVVAGHFAVAEREVFSHSSGVFHSPLFWFGWTGVDLFFVLSGLLIGRQLWREAARTGRVDVRAFILRRGLRIWPLYFAATVLSPVLTATWTYRWGDWLFLSNYVGGRVEGGWSLATEEQFYIVASVLIAVGTRRLRPRSWPGLIASGLALVSVARWYTATRLLHIGMSTHDVKQAMYTPFHLHSEGLAIGLLIALAAVHVPNWLIIGTRTDWVRIIVVISFALILAIVLRLANDIVFPFLSLALIYGATMVALLAIGAERAPAFRARLFYTVSRLSYGMYLNHFAVLRWITPGIARSARSVVGENVGSIGLALVTTVACSASIAFLTFLLIERPFLVLRERIQHASGRAAVTDLPSGVMPRGVTVG